MQQSFLNWVSFLNVIASCYPPSRAQAKGSAAI